MTPELLFAIAAIALLGVAAFLFVHDRREDHRDEL